MKTLAPLILSLAAALLLTACASDGDMWGHRHHDRDHDGDHHLVGSLMLHGAVVAPPTARG